MPFASADRSSRVSFRTTVAYSTQYARLVPIASAPTIESTRWRTVMLTTPATSQPSGIGPKLRIHQRDVLVSRIPEVDEPLAVDALGHLLQELDPAVVVLDEVVVGGEDGGDLALARERRKRRAGSLGGRDDCGAAVAAAASCVVTVRAPDSEGKRAARSARRCRENRSQSAQLVSSGQKGSRRTTTSPKVPYRPVTISRRAQCFASSWYRVTARDERDYRMIGTGTSGALVTDRSYPLSQRSTTSPTVSQITSPTGRRRRQRSTQAAPRRSRRSAPAAPPPRR